MALKAGTADGDRAEQGNNPNQLFRTTAGPNGNTKMTVYQINWEEVPIITYPDDPISPEELEHLKQQLLREYQLGQGPTDNSSNPFYHQGQQIVLWMRYLAHHQLSVAQIQNNLIGIENIAQGLIEFLHLTSRNSQMTITRHHAAITELLNFSRNSSQVGQILNEGLEANFAEVHSSLEANHNLATGANDWVAVLAQELNDRLHPIFENFLEERGVTKSWVSNITQTSINASESMRLNYKAQEAQLNYNNEFRDQYQCLSAQISQMKD